MHFARILAGEFAGGRLLPSESGLEGARYDASRVTIRRALEQLRDEGLLASRQGLGWYASGDEVHQSLDELETLEHQLTSSGVEAARRVLDFSFGLAPAPARAALGTDRVLAVRRLNLADGEPFARVTVWCPETLGSALSRDDVEARPFYELLADTAGVISPAPARPSWQALRRPTTPNSSAFPPISGADLRTNDSFRRWTQRVVQRARVSRSPYGVHRRSGSRRQLRCACRAPLGGVTLHRSGEKRQRP